MNKSSSRVFKIITAIALMLLSNACSSSMGARMADSFPTKAQLQELTASKQTPVMAFGPATQPVETWQLTGPFPEQIGRSTHQPELPWERSFAQGLQGDSALTQELTCAARETGMFYVNKGAYPSDSLDHFIAARCGSVSHQISYWRWELDKTVGQETLQELYDRFESDWAKDAYIQGSPHVDYGIWFGEHEQRRILVIARTKRRAELAPMGRRMGADGTVVIRGQLLHRADRVSGMINRGEFDYEPCKVVESVKLPAFELRCKGDPADPHAYLSIHSGISGQPFDSAVTRQLVWGAMEPQSEYRASTVRTLLGMAPSQAAVTEAALGAQMLASVNYVRAHLQRPELELEAKQSKAVGQAVPYLFGRDVDGLSEEDRELRRSRICQGLRAGWDVSKPISDASFVTDASGSRNVVDVVSSLLEQPEGRATLLKPDPSLLAVGGVVQAGRVAVAAFVYERAIPKTYQALAARVNKELNRKRKEAGHKKFKQLSSFERQAEELSAQLAQGELTLEEVGDQLSQKGVDQTDKSTRYDMRIEHSLEHITLHEALLQTAKLRGTLAVAMYKPAGSPWWVYGIVVVSTTPSDS